MPLDRNKLKQLYSTLQKGGYSQSYDQFENGFTGNNNYANRKKVYDLLRANGAQIGNSYEDFMKRIYTPGATPQRQAPPQQRRAAAPAKSNNGGSGFQFDPNFGKQSQETFFNGGRQTHVGGKYDPIEAGRRQYRASQANNPTVKRQAAQGNPHAKKAVEQGVKAQKEIEGEEAQSRQRRTGQTPQQQARVDASLQIDPEKASKRIQQKMDETAYMAETGKELKNPVEIGTKIGENGEVIGDPLIAPTLARDENGNIQRGANGEPLIGVTSDAERTNAYKQALVERQKPTIDERIKEAEEERERLEEQLKKRGAELDAKNEGSVWRDLPRGGGAGVHTINSTDVNGRNTDTEYLDLLAAQKKVDEQLRDLKAARDEKTGTFLGGAWRGFRDYAFDLSNWDGGYRDLLTSSAMLRSKYGAPKTKREKAAERSMMENTYKADNAAQEAEDALGNGYRFMRIGAQSLPFALNFMAGNLTGITSGIARAGEALGVKAARNIAIKQGANNMLRNLGRSVLRNTGVMLGDLGASTALTTTMQAGQTASDIFNRHVGNVTYDPKTDDYKLENGKSLGRSIYEGVANSVIENYTEMLGEHMHLGKFASSGLSKIGLGDVSNWFTKVGKTDFMQGVSKYMNMAGFNGYPQEVMEEEVGIPLHAIFDGGNQFSDLLDGRQQLDIVGGMLFSMAGMGAGSLALNAGGKVAHKAGMAIQYQQDQHNLNNADKVASFRLTDEKWQPLKEKIDDTTNEDFGKVMSGILSDKSLAPQEKSAVWDYAQRMLIMRGHNMGQVAATKNGMTDRATNASNESYEAGYNAGSEDLNRIKVAYDNARSQAEQTFSPEDLKKIDDDPVSYLRDLGDGEGSQYTRQAVIDYSNAKTVYDGMIQRAKDDLDSKVQDVNMTIDSHVQSADNGGDGMIHPITMKAENDNGTDKKAYIISGNVVMTDDGTMVDDKKSSPSIIIRNEDGSIEMTSPDRILSVDEPLDPETERKQAVESVQQQFAQERANEIDGTLGFAEGDNYQVIGSDNAEHSVNVIQDNGDGTVTAVWDGHTDQPVQLSKDGVQQMSDAYRSQQYAQEQEEANQEEEEAENQEQQPDEQEAEDELPAGTSRETISYEPDMEMKPEVGNSVYVTDKDGNMVHGEVTQTDDLEGKYLVRTDKKVNGKLVQPFNQDEILYEVHRMKPHEDEEANTPDEQQPTDQESETEETQEESPQIVDSGENGGENGGESAEEDEKPQRAIDLIPSQEVDDGKGNVRTVHQWEQAEPGDTYDALTEIYHGNAERVKKGIDNRVGKIDKAIKGVQKKMDAIDNSDDFDEVAAQAEQYDQLQQQKQALQDEKKYWQKVQAVPVTRRGIDIERQKAAAKARAEEERKKAEEAFEQRRREEEAQRQAAEAEAQKAAAEKVNYGSSAEDAVPSSPAEKRHAELEKAKSSSELRTIAKRIYGDDVIGDEEPRTVEELVASNLVPHSLNFEGKTVNGVQQRGVSQELGMEKRGIGNGSDTNPINYWLAPTGQGLSVNQAAHEIWESRPPQMQSVDTEEIKNALLDLLQTATKPRDISDLILRNRIDEAEQMLAADEEREQAAKEQEAWQHDQEVKTITDMLQATVADWNVTPEMEDIINSEVIDETYEDAMIALHRDDDLIEALELINNDNGQNENAEGTGLGEESQRRATERGTAQGEGTVQGEESNQPRDGGSRAEQQGQSAGTEGRTGTAVRGNSSGVQEVNGAERTEMEARIVDWLSEDNLNSATGKTREEIFKEFGNELMPIAYIPSKYLSLVSNTIKDPRIYCGKGYFIDHALRNHASSGKQISPEDIDVSKYLNIQAILDNPDNIKETFIDGKRTVVFIKKIGRYFAELTQEEENGKIVLHKSMFNQKKEPYAKLNDIRQKGTSPEGGTSSISHTGKTASAISLQSRDDVNGSKYDKGKLQNHLDGGAQTEHRPANVSVTASPENMQGKRSSLHPTPQKEESVPLSDSSRPTSTDNQPARLGINSPESSSAKIAQLSRKDKEKAEKVSPEGEKSSIGATSAPEKVETERQGVNTEPSEKQKEAGNYKKGHIKVDGYDITIENPKGSVREKKDANGKVLWRTPMHYDYGYILGTKGTDGDHIDVYLSDNPTSGNVYVVDQIDQKTGKFDEHKVMYGFPSKEAAVEAYKGQYEKGWKVGSVTEVSREDFKKWVESSKRKTKPFSDYKSVKDQAAAQQRPTEPSTRAVGNVGDESQANQDEQAGVDWGFHRSPSRAEKPTKREAALRDGVNELMREAGIEVIDDEKEGQRVLDMANGARLSKDKKRALETASPNLNGTDHQTVIPSADGAKVLKNLDTLVNDFENLSNSPKSFIGSLARALGAQKHGSNSEYATFETKNGRVVTIRLANHNAKVSTFDNHNESDGISIVITANNNAKLTNDGNAHFTEFYYNALKLRRAEGKPLANIVRSIKQALYSGEFKDTTGLAERQEVNVGEIARQQRVYHGSANDFDAFDTMNHLSEGEGSQAFGAGTYVADQRDLGVQYAEIADQNKRLQFELDGKITSTNNYSVNTPEYYAVDMLRRFGKEGAIARLEKRAENYRELSDKFIKIHKDAAELLKNDRIKIPKKNGGKFLYEVDIPKDDGKNYLDWDGELSRNQADTIRKRLYEAVLALNDDYKGSEMYLAQDLSVIKEGGHIGDTYGTISDYLGSDKAASEFLHDLGYTGIKVHAAHNSNDARYKDNWNYVIFNDKDLKITDKVRFFRTANGEAYGFTVGGKIYIDPRIATSETPIHEYAHLWAEALRKVNPKEWANVVELMKGCKEVWEQVTKEYPELETDDEIAEEVLAHYSGKRGAERLRAEAAKAADEAKSDLEKDKVKSAFSRLKDAIKKAWKHIAEDILHIHFTTAEEVADKVMYDLLNKMNPNRFNLSKSVEEQSVKFHKAEFGNSKKAAENEVEAVNKRFNEELEKYKRGEVPIGTRFELGMPSKALESAGFPYLPISMRASLLSKKAGMERHPFEASDLRDLVKAMQMPIAIFKYSKDNMCNLIVDVKHGDKHFLVGITLDYKAGDIEVNSVSGLFPKESHEWIKWIQDGKAIRIDQKKKVLDLIDSLRTNPAESERIGLNLSSAAKIVENFENPVIKGENLSREGEDGSIKDAPTTPSEAEEGSVLYREVDDEEAARLDSEPTVKVYRAMQEHDGKLYPPMSGRVKKQVKTKKGTMRTKWVWRDPIEVGKWEASEEHPEMANEDGTFTLDKGNGSTINAAYNPYIHTSRTPINDQFSSAWSRPELVTVEVEVPASELTSGYHAEMAKDATGEVEWKSGPVGREMAAQGKPRMVILSRWDKPVRIVPVDEVADEYAKRLAGTGITVPFNTVPPALRDALVAKGVTISEPEKGNAGQASRPSYEEWMKGNTRQRDGNGPYTDEELSMINDPFVRMLGESHRSKRQQKEFANRERQNMYDAVKDMAEKLHLDNVEIVTMSLEMTDRSGKVHHPKGFYNKANDKIIIVIPNHRNIEDALQTLLHEGVAHYGLRQLFGSHFDSFLKNVYEAGDMDVRRRIADLAIRKYQGDFSVATEEYLASLAEDTDFEDMNASWWQKIKHMFLAMLHDLGFDNFAGTHMFTLSDNELRYILWRSYENLKEPGRYRSILGEAEDITMQNHLGVGNYAEDKLERDLRQAYNNLDAAEINYQNYEAKKEEDPFRYNPKTAAIYKESVDFWKDKIAELENKHEPLDTEDEFEKERQEREEDAKRIKPRIVNTFRKWLKARRDWEKAVDANADNALELGDELNNMNDMMDAAMDAALDYGIDVSQLLKDNGIKDEDMVEWNDMFAGEPDFYSVVDEMYTNPNFDRSSHLRDRYDIGKTPEWMKKIGILGDNFSLSFKNIKTHQGKDADHDLTREEWHELPNAIQHPFLVTQYKGKNDRFRLYVNMVHNGHYVAVGVDVKRVNQGKNQPILEVNSIKTVFGHHGGITGDEKIIAYDEKITPEQQALLRGLNSHEYPTIQELQSGEDVIGKMSEPSPSDAVSNTSKSQLPNNNGRGMINAEGHKTSSSNAKISNNSDTNVNNSENVTEPAAWGKKDLMSKAEQVSYGIDPDLLFRDTIDDDDNTARETYNAWADAAITKLREAWQDSMINVKNLQDAVLKQRYEKIEDYENAYNAENRSHGVSRAEAEYFDDVIYKPLLKTVNKTAKEAGVSVGDVTEYMMAKHGLERNRVFAERDANAAWKKYQEQQKAKYDEYAKTHPKGKLTQADFIKKSYDDFFNGYRERDYSGLTALTGTDNVQDAEAEAQRIVADMESRADTSDLWTKTWQATSWTLKKAFDSGIISRDNYDYVSKMFGYYIPLRGWDKTTAGDIFDYVGSGAKDTAFSPTLHKAGGRKSQADNPLAYISQMAVSAIVQGNKNKVKQTFFNFVENHPTNLVSVSEMWYRNYGTVTDPDWREDVPYIPENATADEIADIIKKHDEDMEKLKQQGLATKQRGRLHLNVPVKKGQALEHHVEVMLNGKKYIMYINGNPRAAQALNGTRAHRASENSFESSRVANFGRKLAERYTSLSPAFTLSNALRDLTMAAITTLIKEDPKYAIRFRLNVAKLAGPARMFSLMRWYKKLGQSGLNGQNWLSDTQKYFYEFMTQGAETGFTSLKDIEDYKKDMAKEFGNMNQSVINPKRLFRGLKNGLEFANRCIEDMTRFAIYMASRQSGRSIAQSVKDAKNITLNFNRKGSGEMGNSTYRNLQIFINPAIQALQNIVKIAMDHPFKFGGVTGLVALVGVAQPFITQLLAGIFGGGDGDDDDWSPTEEYWKLPTWQRRNNFVFWIPGTKKFAMIPLAQEFRVFHGFGETLSTVLGNHSSENPGLEVLTQAADLLPLDFTGNNGNPLVNVAPTIVQPLLQIGFNTDFTGRPLYKDNDFNKYEPSFQKAYVGTPKELIKFSKWLNEKTGGNDHRQGIVERNLDKLPRIFQLSNPAIIDHYLKGYYGGLYSFFAQLGGSIMTAASGETPDVQEVPIVNRVITTPRESQQRGKQQLPDWYSDMVDEAKRTQNELSGYKRDARDKKEGALNHIEDMTKSEDFKKEMQINALINIVNQIRAAQPSVAEPKNKEEAETKRELDNGLKTVLGKLNTIRTTGKPLTDDDMNDQ